MNNLAEDSLSKYPNSSKIEIKNRLHENSNGKNLIWYKNVIQKFSRERWTTILYSNDFLFEVYFHNRSQIGYFCSKMCCTVISIASIQKLGIYINFFIIIMVQSYVMNKLILNAFSLWIWSLMYFKIEIRLRLQGK